MVEAVFAGAVIAIVVRLISRSASDPNGFVRYSSRGAYIRDLNRKIEEQTGQKPLSLAKALACLVLAKCEVPTAPSNVQCSG